MTTVEVVCQFPDAEGMPASGVVIFAPRPTAILDASLGQIIVPSPVTATLDGEGAISVTLRASDDVGLDPSGWTYQVREMITNAPVRTYDIEIPAAAAGTGIDLADVAPAVAAAGDASAFVTLTAFAVEEAARIADVTGLVADLAGKAPLAAPALTGIPTVNGGLIAQGGDRSLTTGVVDQLTAQAYPAPTTDAPTLTVSGPGGANPIGSGVDYDYTMATGVRALGCYPVTVNQFSTNYSQNQVNGQTGSGAQPWAVEFDTSAGVSDVSLLFRAATATVKFWVWVDGRPVGRGPRVVTANISPGSGSYLRLVFGAAKARRVRIYMAHADYGGLRVATGQTLAATTPVETVKAVFLGDSWFGGAEEGGWPYLLPTVCGLTLGWETFLCGIGGSGYVAGSPPFGNSARTTPLYTVAPNYVVIQGSINDSPSAASVQAAATALYSAIATNLPAAKIIVVGPQPVPQDYATNGATLTANRNAVRTAALAAANVLGFVDPLAGRWLRGTGTLTAPTADGGNNDFYLGGATALHPSRLGAAYYGRRMVEEIVRLLEKNALSY